MPIDLKFIDWAKPALPAVVEYLIGRYAVERTLDLDRVVVAVPGGRVGRRLLELMVDEAAAKSLLLTPPRILTAGDLPEELYERRRPAADQLTQQLAWVKALREFDPTRLARLTGRLPEEDDLAGWMALGQMLSHLHWQLASDALDFLAVVAEGKRFAAFNEASRWQLLAEIQSGYLRVLDDLQLWDTQTARKFAIEHRECRSDRDILLLGMADLDQTQRKMLDQVSERVTAIVFAPQALAVRFDEHGCLRPEAWRDVPIGLEESRIEIVDGPGEQADAVVRAIAGMNGRYAADEITVGVPDERLVPFIRQRLAECELPARWGVGTPLPRTGPFQLLAEGAEYLKSRRFNPLAALLRLPAIAHWLARQGIEGDWLTQLDRYYADHLPSQPAGQWPGGDDHKEVRRVQGAVAGLLAPLSRKPQPIGAWSEPILQLVLDVYGGRELDPSVEADRLTLSACESIKDVLAGHRQISADLSPRIPGADAIELVLRELQGESVPPHSDAAAIELLGWLELPLDDAPALVVTGFNEGFVPAARNGDLFLPNELRGRLHLEDNDRRYARDAYALSVLTASRPELRIIAGRRTDDNDPLMPSRLLLACDDAQLPRRTMVLLHRAGQAARRVVLPGTVRPGGSDADLPIPKPEQLAEQVTSLRVTEFRDYLACPYRYYLRHRLNLTTLDDSASELAPNKFGELLHDVVRAFGTSPAAHSAEVEEIRAELYATLGRIAADGYGESPMPAVQVQIEQMQLRLDAFALRQAEWRREGWRIEFVEERFAERRAPLIVDGEPAYLRGRIDRIDVHESNGGLAVLDYKTSDTAKTPDAAHRRQQQWIDLQLPLYRHLVKALGLNGTIALGYVVVPKDVNQTKFELAKWSDDELADADRAAMDVIRGIRNEVFWPPSRPAPDFFDELAAICHDDQFEAAGRAADAEEESL